MNSVREPSALRIDVSDRSLPSDALNVTVAGSRRSEGRAHFPSLDVAAQSDRRPDEVREIQILFAQPIQLQHRILAVRKSLR